MLWGVKFVVTGQDKSSKDTLVLIHFIFQSILGLVSYLNRCHTRGVGGGGVRKVLKSVTYHFNGIFMDDKLDRFNMKESI
jgi:hypothetical protein